MWQIIYDVNMLIYAWLACLNALIISFLLNLGHMKYKERVKKESSLVFFVILQWSDFNIRRTNLNVCCDAFGMTEEEVGGDAACKQPKSRKSACIAPLRSFKSGSTQEQLSLALK